MAEGAGSFWRRHRRWMVVGLVAGWVAVISLSHAWLSRRPAGTTKGARELLQIGALPVT